MDGLLWRACKVVVVCCVSVVTISRSVLEKCTLGVLEIFESSKMNMRESASCTNIVAVIHENEHPVSRRTQLLLFLFFSPKPRVECPLSPSLSSSSFQHQNMHHEDDFFLSESGFAESNGKKGPKKRRKLNKFVRQSRDDDAWEFGRSSVG